METKQRETVGDRLSMEFQWLTGQMVPPKQSECSLGMSSKMITMVQRFSLIKHKIAQVKKQCWGKLLLSSYCVNYHLLQLSTWERRAVSQQGINYVCQFLNNA